MIDTDQPDRRKLDGDCLSVDELLNRPAAAAGKTLDVDAGRVNLDAGSVMALNLAHVAAIEAVESALTLSPTPAVVHRLKLARRYLRLAKSVFKNGCVVQHAMHKIMAERKA